MTAWRKKVVELFPDIESELRTNFSPYNLFMNLLMRCEKAHKQNDTEELDKIYDFAEWSLNHKSPDLSNAAGVSFYEHLVDHPITARSIPRFIKPHVFEDVAGLLEWRLGERKFKS